MSRILLMVLFLVWLAWPGEQRWSVAEQWPWLVLFIGFYVFLVVLLGLWSRVLARRIDATNFQQSVRRFNHTMFAARLLVMGPPGGDVSGLLRGTRGTILFDLGASKRHAAPVRPRLSVEGAKRSVESDHLRRTPGRIRPMARRS